MRYYCDACREWLHASTRDELARKVLRHDTSAYHRKRDVHVRGRK
jgi:hypothetical protein